jgi:hypothetical protein
MELSDELVGIFSAFEKELTPSLGDVVLIGACVRRHHLLIGFLAVGQSPDQTRLAGRNHSKGANASS